MKITMHLFFILFITFSLGAQDQINVIVRPASNDELDEVLALDREISYEYFKPIFEQYENIDPDAILEQDLVHDAEIFSACVQQIDNQYLYVAHAQKSIVGFINFHKDDESVVIDLLCIQKNYRQKGIGKKLVNQVLQLFPNNNFRLAVIEKNKQACDFWQKCTFKLLDKKPDNVGNDFPTECTYSYYQLTNGYQ